MNAHRRAIPLLILTAVLAAADSWSTRAPMVTARHGTTSAPACNVIFTIGGKNSTTDLSATEVYDPALNSWRQRTDMPIARNGVSSGAVNNKIYVFGGTSNGSINYEYDPTTDTWTTRAAMPTARYEIASVVLNDKIYALGGRFGAETTPVMEIYDPSSDTWTAGPPMPISRSAACASAVGGKIYVMGGYTASMAYLNTHEVYDTATQTWTTAAPLPTARASHVCGAVGTVIFVISGYNGHDHLTVNEAYDTQNNTWQTKASILTPRKGAGCAVHGNKIYVTGGSNSVYLTTCEEYTPDPIGIEEESGTKRQDENRFEAIMTSRGIQILYAPESRSEARVVLYDANGRKVAEWSEALARNMILRPNSGTDFPKGVYFLSVTTEGLKAVKKLVCCR